MQKGRNHTPALLLAAALWLVPLAARGQSLTYINNLGPFVYTEEGATQGVVYDMIHTLARRRDYKGAIEAVPLKRRIAQLTALPNAFGVIWREADNETRFTWLFKLLDDKVVLLALRDSKTDISSIAAVRELRIGVVLGSPAEALARKLGFSHIEAIASADNNARKMQVGRIDAWLGLDSVATYTERQPGAGLPQFRRGAVIGTVDLYFACGHQCDQAEAQKWTAAYNAARADGTLGGILAKYRFR